MPQYEHCTDTIILRTLYFCALLVACFVIFFQAMRQILLAILQNRNKCSKIRPGFCTTTTNCQKITMKSTVFPECCDILQYIIGRNASLKTILILEASSSKQYCVLYYQREGGIHRSYLYADKKKPLTSSFKDSREKLKNSSNFNYDEQI